MNESLEEVGGDAHTVGTMTLGALHQMLHLHNSLQHFIYICIHIYKYAYMYIYTCILAAKLLDYFLRSNKSNINRVCASCLCVFIMCILHITACFNLLQSSVLLDVAL